MYNSRDFKVGMIINFVGSRKRKCVITTIHDEFIFYRRWAEEKSKHITGTFGLPIESEYIEIIG